MRLLEQEGAQGLLVKHTDLVLRGVYFLKGHLKWLPRLYRELPLCFWKLLLQLDLSVALFASRVDYF